MRPVISLLNPVHRKFQTALLPVCLLFSIALLACHELAFASTSNSLPDSPVGFSDYGTLYVLEQTEHPVHLWRTSLFYGYELGNPYLNVHSASYVFERSVSRFTWIGMQFNAYLSGPTTLMKALREELQVKNIGTQFSVPIFSAYPIITLVPLRGHLSFFGKKPLEAELSLRAGAGYITYTDHPGRFGLLWSIRPSLHLNSQLSIQAGFGQEIESPFTPSDRLFNFRTDLGVSFQL